MIGDCRHTTNPSKQRGGLIWTTLRKECLFLWTATETETVEITTPVTTAVTAVMGMGTGPAADESTSQIKEVMKMKNRNYGGGDDNGGGCDTPEGGEIEGD